MIDRETPVGIGWGIATRDSNATNGYRLVEIEVNRDVARATANRMNQRSKTRRYRTVRLSATHP